MIKKIARYLYKRHKLYQENKYYGNFWEYIDFSKVTQEIPTKINKISFVIPDMVPYSGGHTSILRLGTHLSELGYDIYYISYRNQDIKTMEKNAKVNLKHYKGIVLDSSYLKDFKTDVFIATLWESVYYIKDLKGYKMYFVQDYEPYFYTYGEKFLLAKKSYELGFHIVNLGKWNKEMIERSCNNIDCIDYIDFPYEKSEYTPIMRDFQSYKNKKEISIAVYVKFYEKRAPFIIQTILENLKREFNKDGVNLKINYFGAEKNDKFINGINLGKLNKEQLYDLYKKSDFGMVASLTNISLVPYEMIATKLPVIEFDEGTFKYFFDEDCGIISSFDWKVLYSKIKNYMNNGEELEKIVDRAFNNISKLSWEKSASQFKQILENIYNEDL